MTATRATTNQHPANGQRSEAGPATRSAAHDARAVLSALRSEWIKASTVRAFGAILAFALVGGLLVSWAVATFVTDEVLFVAQVGFYWTSVTSMLAAIGGVLLFGSEVQHGTLAAAVAARPARWIVAVAKTLTAAVLGLVVGAAGLAAGFGGAVIAGLAAGDTSALGATVSWALLFTTLSAVLGLGIGMIVRNSTAAIGGVLVWGFVVENLLNLFLPVEVARFLPFFAGNKLLAYANDFDTPEAIAVALTRSESALVFAGYAGVALLVGTVLLYRRDTD
jgi:ABC-2 type transport system permease protein